MIAEAWKTDLREVPSTTGLASAGSTVAGVAGDCQLPAETCKAAVLGRNNKNAFAK